MDLQEDLAGAEAKLFRHVSMAGSLIANRPSPFQHRFRLAGVVTCASRSLGCPPQAAAPGVVVGPGGVPPMDGPGRDSVARLLIAYRLDGRSASESPSPKIEN